MYKSLLAALGLIAGIHSASAATFVVNSTADTPDAALNDGFCGAPPPPSGPTPNTCTLRAAIQEANSNTAASNTIDLTGMTGTNGSTTVLSNLDPITKSVSIVGPSSRFTVSGGSTPGPSPQPNNNFSLLRFTGSGGTYSISNLIITNGKTTNAAGGGGIYFGAVGSATFTLTNVDVTGSVATAGPGGGIAVNLTTSGSSVDMKGVAIGGNTAAAGDGGGLWARLATSGSMILESGSSVTGNSAVNGGGIAVKRGRLEIYQSTINNNTATTVGGGVYLASEQLPDSSFTGGTVRMDNDTVSGNTASTGGGGLATASNNPTASWMTFTTVTANTTSSGGGGIATSGSTTFPGNLSNPFTSNIIANNSDSASPTAKNCKTAFAHSDANNSGYNLSDDASCGFVEGTNHDHVVTTANLKLAALANNPVAPATHALQAGSIAIDAGNPNWDTGIDERAAATQDGSASGLAPVRDIGAYEFGGFGLIQFGFPAAANNFDVDEDNGPVLVLIKRYGVATAASTAPNVTFKTMDGTATAGSPCDRTVGNTDYTFATPTDFTFTGTAGLTQFDRTASIAICNDQVVEGNETFNIALTKASTGYTGYDLGPRSSGTVTIKDVENGEFGFQSTTARAAEGNPGANGSITLTIVRTAGKGSNGAVRVNYSTRADSNCTAASSTSFTTCATADVDYTSVASGSVDFANGDTSKTVTINFIGDAKFEADETFQVNLTGVSCLAAGRSCDARLIGTNTDPKRTTTVTIDNDDAAIPGKFQFEFGQYTATKAANGTLTVKVKRVGGTDGAVTVDYSATDGSAKSVPTAADPDADYALSPAAPGSHTLSWDIGDAADKTFDVTLFADAQRESNKTFALGFLNSTGCPDPRATTNCFSPGSPATATVTLVSNMPPRFQFDSSANCATNYCVNEGAGQVQLIGNVTSDKFSGPPVTVPFFTQDGTATSPIDYTGVPQSSPTLLSFDGSGTAQPFSIAIKPDGPGTPNETFTVNLGQPTNGGVITGTNPATVTIINPAAVRFTAASFTRANEANGSTITVSVERIGDLSQALSVDFAISQNCSNPRTTPGCAEEAVDYTRSQGFTGTLSWPANTASTDTIRTFTVTVVGDTIIEGDESIKLDLRNAVTPGVGAAVLGNPSTALAVIPDDDYRFEIADVSPVAVGESAGNAVISVRRFGSTLGAASVKYATADGTAIAGTDYTATSGTLNWAAGEGGIKTLSVPIINNSIDQPNRSFTLALNTPSNNVSGEATSITGSPLTVNIIDDDSTTVSFSAATQSVGEAVGTVTVTAVRTGATTFDISIPFTVSGTATNPADHNAANGTITILAGSTSGTYTFRVVDDTLDEPNETVVFTMGIPTGGKVSAAAPGTHTVTIVDNDSTTVSFSAATQSVGEAVGTVTVTAVRTGATTFAISIPFTVSGTASNPADHNAANGTITIPAASASGTYTFQVVDDALDEPNETVVFTMGTPTGGKVSAAAPGTHTVTIVDNDSTTVSFSTATQSVGEAVGTVTVTAVRTGAMNLGVSIPFTVSGTASNPDDHNAANGTITIPAGSTSGAYTFQVVDDALVEADETVVFTIGTPTGGKVSAVAPSMQTVTIVDNDSVTAGGQAPGIVVTPSGNVASGSGSGGGAFSWSSILALLGLGGLRRRRVRAGLTMLALLGWALAPVDAQAGTAPGVRTTASAGTAQKAALPASLLSYNSFDLRYLQVKVSDPSVSASGFSAAGSWAAGQRVFLTVGYSSIATGDFALSGTTGSTKTDTLAGGLGFHAPIKPNLDFTGAASLLSADAKGRGGFSGSTKDTGFGLEAGLRGIASQSFEWSAGLNYVSIFSDSDTALALQAIYYLNRKCALLLGAGFGSNTRQGNLGLRFNY